MRKVVLTFLLFSCLYSLADDFKTTFFTGYSFAKTKSYGNYEFYTFIADFTKPIKGSKSCFFQIEPSIAHVLNPSDNFEIGVSLFALYRFSGSNFQPYVKIGTGIVYFSTDFTEQATHFNFATSIGLGLKFSLKRFSIYTEGRFRHVSNAGIKLPNEGINSKIFLFGIGYNF
ncbi:MAG: acyloxyacyl hydrolase [Candidatus Omnitrophica bacterium]|nr:acyloxyacyl hydrolase [Candidatus Omnitrophota bacterium]MCM8802439.1 acyloxyacyl hydrolase [Candidatus Omnitrophota bacterium]